MTEKSSTTATTGSLFQDNRRLAVLVPLLVAVLLPVAQLFPEGAAQIAVQVVTVVVLLALVYRMGRNERARREG